MNARGTSLPLRLFLQRWLVNAVAVLVAANVIRGIEYDTSVGLLMASLLLGILNALLRPLLWLLSLALVVFTLGLFTLVINALLFALTAWLGKLVGIPIQFAEPWLWSAFLGSLVTTAVSMVLSLILRDELRGRHFQKRRK